MTGLPRLLVVTERSLLPPGRTLEDQVDRCLAGGAPAVLVREPDLDSARRAGLVMQVRAAGAMALSARALVGQAHGVHLSARQALPEPAPGVLLGRSCHDGPQVAGAVRDRVDYLTVSPVGASASKPGYGPALGLEGAALLAARSAGTPVLALGGVTVAQVRGLRDAGLHGVAVMGALMRADDPADVIGALLGELS